jgi:8-oxo-dGTP pyrophosphatase MutT (NUDIX family)
MESEQQSKVIVSAILLKKDTKKFKIFLQTRWKPKVSPTYSGMFEIPAGGIDSYENVYDALRREVKEETNLDIVRIIGDYQSEVFNPRKKDKAFIFKPFVCQQVLKTNNGLPWIGFVFLCEVKGGTKINKKEAKDPRWVSVEELKEIIEKDEKNIFPLQLPVIKYFIENFENILMNF